MFGVIVALVFHIGQSEQLVELGKVNVALLEDLLSFRFIPSNPHRQRVYKYYTVLQRGSGVCTLQTASNRTSSTEAKRLSLLSWLRTQT